MSEQRVTLVSDLDHTMVQNEDTTHKRLLAFDHLWTTHCKTSGNLLVFSTGRSPTLFAKLWEEAPLLTPDVLICSVGTEIFYNLESPVASLLAGSNNAVPTRGWATFVPDPHWEKVLDDGWSRQEIESLVSACCPQLKKQVDTEQRPHKISYTWKDKDNTDEMLNNLRKSIEEKGLKAKVIYSGGQDVDVLAFNAGKGCGLGFLLKRLREAGWNLEHVQVNGDSGNDSELFDVPGVVGCVVANAHPELRQHAIKLEASGATHVLQASNPCAGGIIEAMSHFGLLPAQSPILASYSTLLGKAAHLVDQHASTHGAEGSIGDIPSGSAAVQAAYGAAHRHTAIPDVAQPAPATDEKVAYVIEGRAGDIPEDSAEIQAAAHAAGGRAAAGLSPAGPGDTALQQLQSGFPEQQVSKGGTVSKNPLLTLMEGAREWSWRLGLALAQQLVQGIDCERGHQLPHHSPLRLFVTNDCKIALEGSPSLHHCPEIGHASTQPIEMAEDQNLEGRDAPDVSELKEDLESTGAKDASSHDIGSLVSRAWIDQLSLKIGSNTQVEAGPTPTTTSETCMQIAFKVCMIQPDGMRSPSAWSISVDAIRPTEPVPHGFLATGIKVAGPLSSEQRQLFLPGLTEVGSVGI